MPLQGSLSIERMCQLTGVSRAGFYRSLQGRAPAEEDMEVRSAMQQIAIEHRRRYGYRRISAELRRRGMLVNHKRVLRIMREDNVLAVQSRAFVVTTDSDHEFEVYLNLASRMKLTGMNQLWVADITYIRLQKEFVYLAVILDAFSRKVVGWALDRTLAARLPIAAREQAIAQRQPPPGLVDHSDRGVQYASGEYATVLRKRQMIPSMSRPANPYDNASCESFMKTLKREEIYAFSIAKTEQEVFTAMVALKRGRIICGRVDRRARSAGRVYSHADVRPKGTPTSWLRACVIDLDPAQRLCRTIVLWATNACVLCSQWLYAEKPRARASCRTTVGRSKRSKRDA
jgi:putative transposase